MTQLFRTDFAPVGTRRSTSWGLLVIGAVSLALATHWLGETRDALSKVAAERGGGTSTATAVRASHAQGNELTASMHRQISYPWAQLLREVESVRGLGVRVVSLEQDGSSGRAVLVVEVARTADLNAVLMQLAADNERAAAWVTESVVAQGAAYHARMRRRAL